MPLRFQPRRGAAGLAINSLFRGPAGSAATITAGTTSTGSAGSSASVANSGSTSAAVFDFSIPRGTDSGVKWTFDSSTSMADPGSGEIRLDNATVGSVANIAVSAASGGSDVSDFVAAWDDSGNTVKGYILIREEAGSEQAVFRISSVTDNTTWLQIVVVYVSGSLTLTAGDALYLTPLRSGEPGAIGGSTGGTDRAVIIANGAGGTSVQASASLIDSGNNLKPAVNDTGALGTTALSWADLFLASGGVINWNAGDVTITPSANLLAFAGASSGYTFDAAPLPSANDGAALGASGTAWADLFLASGAVINFNAGNYTLTHSAGALTANGSFSVGTSNAITAGTIELGNASDTTLARSAAGTVTVEGSVVKLAGTETIYIPAKAMDSRTTNGAASGTVEMTTNKNMFKTLDFDTSTQEFAQFTIRMPKSWNESTVTAAFTWSHAATVTNFGVVWALEAVATSDDDAGDVAFGTAQQIADTGGTTNDIYITSSTPAITVAGSPAAEDYVTFQVKRVPADGSDTMTIDARLHGVTLYITTDAKNDA